MAGPDRDKLRAGLAGILSGGDAEAPEAEALPEAPSTSAAPSRKRSARAPRTAKEAPAPPSPRTKAAAPSEAEPDGGDHVRTSTGYVKADGEQVHRVSLMLTKSERRALRNRAEDAGLSVTDYVRQALGL